jgi:hypothetical protein
MNGASSCCSKTQRKEGKMETRPADFRLGIFQRRSRRTDPSRQRLPSTLIGEANPSLTCAAVETKINRAIRPASPSAASRHGPPFVKVVEHEKSRSSPRRRQKRAPPTNGALRLGKRQGPEICCG